MDHEIKIEAINKLAPNAMWELRGKGTYSDIVWLDDNIGKPSEKEYNETVDRLLAEAPINALRKQRDRIIAETDWIITMHKEKGTDIPTEWKTYRQALRDITETYSSLDDVVWPEKPE